jgi:hypothetical protein
MKYKTGISALVVVFTMTASATAADRVETVRFARGATSATVKGTIRGYDGIKYLVNASKGQVMSVLFNPGNRFCYMNVFAPGTETAAFMGSTSGNEYALNPTASGDYAIQVYLMRNAARRNETCRYGVTIEITGAPGGVSDTEMKDRCKGAAAGMYGVQPRRISAGSPRAVSSGFEIDGTADKGAEGVKKLRCIFKPDRTLDHIMAMTSDGE